MKSKSYCEPHDVAISFLVKDGSIAREFYQQLSPHLKVFFFPHTQEELAGTDGMESMRLPFLNARLTLVLFSDGWGETPWTRVEATAIKESCLDRGWDHLFFVDLNKAAKLPIWLPKTHVRLNYKDYGIKQAVGAVKARVEELGGKLMRPNAQAVARNAKIELAYEAARQSKFRDQGWIFSEVHTSVNRILQHVAEKVQSIVKDDELEVSHAVVTNSNGFPASFVANYNLHGLSIYWEQRILNSLEKAKLEAKMWNGEVALPGYYHPHSRPSAFKTLSYLPDMARDGSVMWKREVSSELVDEEIVAEEILSDYFTAVVARANKPQDYRSIYYDEQ